MKTFNDLFKGHGFQVAMLAWKVWRFGMAKECSPIWGKVFISKPDASFLYFSASKHKNLAQLLYMPAKQNFSEEIDAL